MGDPAMMGVAREEQRRRILSALEAPLPAQTAPVGRSKGSPGVTAPSKVDRRLEALRRQMYATEDHDTRIELAEQIRELARSDRGARGAN